MYYMPICPYNCPYYRMRQIKSYIRVLHASPEAPAVDVYANEKPIAKNLAYRGFTPYITVTPGEYRIKVFPAGKTTGALIDTTLNIPGESIFTVAAIGKFPNISLFPIPEPRRSVAPGKLFVRFANLSPDAPAVDVTTPDGKKLFEDVSYKEVADYIELNPETYIINIKPAGTDRTILYVPNIRLTEGRLYTIYMIGLAGGRPSLQVLIPLDGSSYLR